MSAYLARLDLPLWVQQCVTIYALAASIFGLVLNYRWILSADLRYSYRTGRAEAAAAHMDSVTASDAARFKLWASDAEEDLLHIDAAMYRLQKLRHAAEEARYRCAAVAAPVRRVPTELVLDIFAFALPYFGFNCGTSLAPRLDNPHTTVGTLQLVCRQWRDVVASHPEFFSDISIGAFIPPIPTGPWKLSSMATPWDVPSPDIFRHLDGLNDDNVVVPLRYGPASNYVNRLLTSGLHYARRAMAKSCLINLDLRWIETYEQARAIVVAFHKCCGHLSSFIMTGVDSELVELLDCIALGDVDISTPFVNFNDFDEMIDRRNLRRREGREFKNRFQNLRTVYIRHRNAYPSHLDRIKFPDFLKGGLSCTLRHLSINNIFSLTNLSMRGVDLSAIETLELNNFQEWEGMRTLLSCTSKVKDVIFVLGHSCGPPQLLPEPVVIPSAERVTYCPANDKDLMFLKAFQFPTIEKLTLSVLAVHMANGWLTSRAAELLVLRRFYQEMSQETAPGQFHWAGLEHIELAHLDSVDVEVVVNDFRAFADTLSQATPSGTELFKRLRISCNSESDFIPPGQKFFSAAAVNAPFRFI